MLLNTLLFSLGGPEIIILALLVLLIFGGKKIPELMNGLGKGVSSFKKGLNDMEEEVKDIDKDINKDINKNKKDN